MYIYLCVLDFCCTFAPAFRQKTLRGYGTGEAQGTLAQVVEQWTENPCVLGSTPRGTTQMLPVKCAGSFFIVLKQRFLPVII